MQQIQNFRSAFNGFNREDVVHYLEYINNRHSMELAQLSGEVEELRRRLEENNAAQLQAELEDAQEEKQSLQAEIAALSVQLEQVTVEKNALAAKVEELEKAEPAPAPAPVEEKKESWSAVAELEAYRRAERAERAAKERAEQVYRKTNGLLADATCKVDDAANLIGSAADQVVTQLSALQAAVNTSRAALQEAADSLYSLKPEE